MTVRRGGGVFFSSRRRHTRLVSDWSSDVCSSDLEHIRAALAHRADITMDDGADLVGALHMIALNRLDDLAPPVRKWVETLSAADRKEIGRASCRERV